MTGFWIEFSIILLGFAAAALLFYKMPRLPSAHKAQTSLRVSVIIPARNEAKTLPLLLGDLARQTVIPLEILVADDASEDDTAAIARSFDATVLSLPEKPADWVGKSWACQKGAEAATGDLFLFLDADVRLAPDALDRILAAYEAGGTVSVQPYHATRKAYEQFSFFFNLIQIGAIGAALPKSKQFGLFGPVVAISRANYFAAGGHESVKASVLEDMALAGQLQRSGVPFRLFVGESDVSFRMYPAGFRSLLQGFSKNLATGAVKTPLWLILMVTLFFASLASVPLHLTLALLRGEAIALLYASLYPVWVLALFLLGRRIGRFWPVSVLLYPLPLAFYLLIFLYSGLLRLFRCKVKWKGRAVPLER
jgi:4,4'-diaponeurosporenoate glycosyltransferase